METTYDETEDYNQFVQELDDNMWGCFGWLAIIGIMILLITLILKNA